MPESESESESELRSILDLKPDALANLETQLCKERTDAITARKKQGLDSIWSKARKQYQGIEINSNNSSVSSMEKGETLDSSLTAYQDKPDSKGSSVVVNITRPYTNSGTAKVADILLPTNRLPFELKQTPVSDLETLRGALTKYPELATVIQERTPDLFERLNIDADLSKEALAKATLMIKDYLKESNWSGQVRDQIIEAGKVGSGIIKGPFPKARKLSADIQALLDVLPSVLPENQVGEQIHNDLRVLLELTPHIETIKVENCYPDKDCGTNIQNGRYFYERVPEITKQQLKDFKIDSSYSTDQINLCLDEGPKSVDKKDDKKNNSSYELWIRTGMLETKSDIEEESTEFGFQVTILCNEHIIKSEQYWLDTPTFPYWVLNWEPRENSWAGIGIPEQIETPQRGLNSAVRALMDNMGYSVGPQVLELADILEPADGDDWTMRPYKRWKIKSALPGMEAVREAKSALSFLEFPNYLNEIMPVIQYWMKMAEDTTGLSLLLQGQAVTDAVGVSQQLMANATTNLRLIIKEWDDKTCYPMMTAFYEWTQMYGPPEVMGDGVVEPLGSTTLIVRELQQQALLQIGDKILQPIYGISPKKWMATYLEGFQMDIENLAMTKEELKTLQDAEGTPDDSVVVANIEAEVDQQKIKVDDEFNRLKLLVDSDFKELAESQKEALAIFDAEVKLEQEVIKQEGQDGQLAQSAAAPNPDLSVDNALDQLGLE